MAPSTSTSSRRPSPSATVNERSALLDSAQSPAAWGAVAGAEIAGAVPDESEGPNEATSEEEREIEQAGKKEADGRLHGFRLAITL